MYKIFPNYTGKDPSVTLAGLGARDSLRLEGSLCLYGQDISENISPIEAGLAWAIQKSRREGGEREGNFPGSNNIISNKKWCRKKPYRFDTGR